MFTVSNAEWVKNRGSHINAYKLPNYVSKTTTQTQTHPLLVVLVQFKTWIMAEHIMLSMFSTLIYPWPQDNKPLICQKLDFFFLNMAIEISSSCWGRSKNPLWLPLLEPAQQEEWKSATLPRFLHLPKEYSVHKYAKVYKFKCQKCFNMSIIRPQGWKMFLHYNKGVRRKKHCTDRPNYEVNQGEFTHTFRLHKMQWKIIWAAYNLQCHHRILNSFLDKTLCIYYNNPW